MDESIRLSCSSSTCSSSKVQPTTRPFPLYTYVIWGIVFILALASIGLIAWAISKLVGTSSAPKDHKKVRPNEAGCGLVDAIEPVQTLVVDGEFAENKFPWTVLVYTKIGRNLISYGTGALITPLHVLTAAHLLLTPGSDVVVLYGSNLIRLMKPVSVTGIRRISSHFKEIEDIMLLLLETELNNISRLCVPSWKTTGNDSLIINLGRDFPKPGDNITIAGFGALSESIPGEGGELPKELMYTTETVLPNAYCEADTEGFDSQTAFCAKSVATGICRGDSGASAMLLVQQRLVAVGIAASSRFCGYSPDRYIRVAVYLEWLHTSINDSPKDFSTPE